MRGLLAGLVVALVIAGCAGGGDSDTTMSRAIEALVSEPSAYSIDIEAAGIASIDEVRGSDDGFELDYSYAATDGSGEDRSGSMTLRESDSEPSTGVSGEWRTVATNGTVYSGDLRFDFADDGTASGTYDFAGSTFRITITRP